MIFPRLLITSSLLCLLALPALGLESRFRDFGSAEDVAESSDIYLFPNSALRIGQNPAEYVQYEKGQKDFRWCTQPANLDGYITARVVQAGSAVEIRTQAFKATPQNIFLQVRYKDHLVSPVSIWSLGSNDWRQAGELPGSFDHRWKSVEINIPGSMVASSEGLYRFRLGRQDGSDVVGEIPIDLIRISESTMPMIPDNDGYFPSAYPSRFDELSINKSYKPGDKPFLPVGVVVNSGRTVTWKQVRELGASSVSMIGWNNNWRSLWRVTSDNKFVDRTEAGLPEWLANAETNDLKHVPAFNTDGFSWFIRSVYGSEKDTLKALANIVKENTRQKSLLAWMMKTQVDNSNSGMGCPLEYALELGNIRKANDPLHPTAMLFSSDKPQVYQYFADATDIIAVDYYAFSEGNSLGELGKRISAAISQTKEKKTIWAIVEAGTSDGIKRMGRQLAAKEVVAQAYIALCHGAQGVWFYIGGGGQYLDLSDLKKPQDGIRRFADEMFDKDKPIAKYFLPPFQTVEIMGARQIVQTSDPAIHFIVQKSPDGIWHLIAVNESAEPKINVRFTSDAFSAGKVVIIEQEDRLLALTEGTMTDDFEGYQRHIYQIVPF